MNKTIIIVIAFLLASSIAMAGRYSAVEGDANKVLENYGFNMSFDPSVDNFQEFASIDNGFLVLSLQEKVLSLSLDSFADSSSYMKDIQVAYRPDNIKVEIQDLMPTIIFEKGDTPIVTIRQPSAGATKLYYGVPSQIALENATGIAYIVEHYDPDLEIADDARRQGSGRLDVVTKDAGIEITNVFMSKPGSLKIKVKDFFAETQKRQIDTLQKDKAVEIIIDFREIIVRQFDHLFDGLFDRGFRAAGESAVKTIDITENDSFIDIFAGNCSNFGFITDTAKDLPYIRGFSNSTGYALFITNFSVGNYDSELNRMVSLVQSAIAENITPIVRINSESYLLSPGQAAEFATKLRQISGIPVLYIQVYDSPNLKKDSSLFKTPEEYVHYFVDVKSGVEDPQIKLLPADLTLGGKIASPYVREDPQEYFSAMLDSKEFLGSVDYWAADMDGIDYPGQNCIIGAAITDYAGQDLCLYSKDSYRFQLEKIKEVSGKDLEVFLFAGKLQPDDANLFSAREQLKGLLGDRNVKSAILPQGTWGYENEYTKFFGKISSDICS